MDVKAIIDQVLEKAKNDPSFAVDFAKDPVKKIESITGMDLPDDQINPVIDGIKAKIGASVTPDTIADAVKNLGGLFGKQ